MRSTKSCTSLCVVSLLFLLANAGLSAGVECFGGKLFNEIIHSNPGKNIVVSTFSIETCMAMLRMGADGNTAHELDKALNSTISELNTMAIGFQTKLKKYENSNSFKLANKIYVANEYPINQNFNTIISEQFLSNAENLDFTQTENAARAINEWLLAKTGNEINKLENSLSPATNMLLVSAAHFSGKWKIGFNETWTKLDKFYIDESDNVIMLPMMKVRSYFRYGRQSAMNAGAILLPYKDLGLSMLVVVPFRADGLQKVVQTMTTLDIPSFVETNVFQRKRIEFRMPKFKIDTKIDLNDSLKKIGIEHIFENGDFDKMLISPDPLAVNEFIHQTTFEVSEEGDPAPIVSTSDHYNRNNPFFRFSADGPFFYAILSKEFIPLIAGVFVGA
ncbi:antitrypsin-like [Musca autumnalis]|uniref:antitrypsin-like n=1 Tax=Musca autumnalis TaxID=221902 RepID=UPI003CEA0D41